MSGGEVCKCKESKKPITQRAWLVTQRRGNHSAFNGGRHTPSQYSAVRCFECGSIWRTKAKYVYTLADAKHNWWAT